MSNATPTSTFVEENLLGGLITDDLIQDEIIDSDGTCLWFRSLPEDIRNKINDQHILYVLNHDLVDLEKVEDVELKYCIKITDTSLINIANKCPSLDELNISECVKITATGIAAITEKFGAQLKTLRYSGCVNCGNVAFESIVMQCTELEHLEADNTETTAIPETIGEKMPQLKYLFLRDNNIASIPPSIGQHKRIEQLDLRNNNITRIPPSIGQHKQLSTPNGGLLIDTKPLKNIPDYFPNKVQLQHNFQNGPGPTHGFLGETQKGWGPEMWGITLHQIEEVLKHPLIHVDTLMRDVVKLVIKPTTKQCGVGYALLLNQDKPLHANVMVSHAWDETIGAFIDCLRRSGKKGPFWVCAFSIYQSDGEGDSPTIGEQLGSNPEYGPFATVLKGAKSMIAVVTDVCDIYTRLWCVYELFMAQKLDVDVQLCAQMLIGKAQYDECVVNIHGNAVDSENAFCSWEPDKVSIHKAIQENPSENGFNGINKAVERIRLDYLLKHIVIDLEHHIKDYSVYMVQDYQLRYKTIFAPLFIIGIVAYLAILVPLLINGINYSMGYHFCFLALPLLGLLFDILVKFIGNDALTSKWMRLLGTINVKWDYFVRHFEEKDYRDEKREAIEALVDAIILMVERIYFIGDDVPSFKDYCESSKAWSFVYEWAPIFVFQCWTKEVERLIRQRDERVVENMTVNESTPLNIV